jgi:signal peptidase I
MTVSRGHGGTFPGRHAARIHFRPGTPPPSLATANSMSDDPANPPAPWWQVATVGRNPRTTLIRLLITAVLVYVGFRVSIQPVRVSGISMAPAYRDGQRKFINKLAYRFAPPRRGDVIAIRDAGKQVLLLKRVIGLPGERLRIVAGNVLIDGEPLDEPYLLPPADGIRNPAPWRIDEVRLKSDEHYVIGDNRSMRQEDHYFGIVNDSRIIGRLISP